MRAGYPENGSRIGTQGRVMRGATFRSEIAVAAIFILLAVALSPLAPTPAIAATSDRDSCTSVDAAAESIIASCSRVLAREGQNLSAHNRAVTLGHRGFAYQRKGEYDRAMRDFDDVIRLNPPHAV